MKLFQSREQRRKNKEIIKMKKETIEELNDRLIIINKKFLDKVDEFDKAKNQFTDKKTFLEVQQKNDENILNVTKNMYEEININQEKTLKELFANNYEFINNIYQDNNKVYQNFSQQLLNVENKFVDYENIKEIADSLMEKQIHQESEIKNMLLIGQGLKDEALQMVDNTLKSTKTIEQVADKGAKIILDAFNEELSEFTIKEKKSIVEAIKSILEQKNIIIQNNLIEKRTEPKKLDKNEIMHNSYSKVKSVVLSGVIPMVVGPAGSGKSHAMEQIAKDLGINFYMANRIQNTFELVGFVDAAGKYVTTQFFEAFTKGGLFFFDEVDASSPEALVTINAAVAQRVMAFPGHSENQKMHKDFKAVVAGNTYGTGSTLQYTGRNKLDAATLDRFMVIDWHYDKELENKIIPDKELLKICWDLRDIVNKLQLEFNETNRNRDNNPFDAIIISTRGIENLGRIFAQEEKNQTMSRKELFKSKFFASTKKDIMKQILNELKLVKTLKSNKFLKDIVEVLQ